MSLPEVDTSYAPMTNVLRATIMAALSFVLAMSIRDFMKEGLSMTVPSTHRDKLVFLFFIAIVFLFLTVLLAYYWV